MAITNNGTRVVADVDKLPIGYTLPTVTAFTDFEYKRDATLNVDRATVMNATKVTTMANILANATIGLNKQITDLVTADFDALKTITIWSEVYEIDSNLPTNQTGDLFGNTADLFVCKVRIYVKGV